MCRSGRLSDSTNDTPTSSNSSNGPEDELLSNHEQLPPDEQFQSARERLDRDYLVIGRELFLAFSSGRYRKDGYESFDDYVRRKCGMDPGRARRLRRVFKVFQRDLGVPAARLHAIGYERASLLLPVIRRENAEIWLARAESMPYDDLAKQVKAEKKPRKKRQVVVQPPGTDPQSYEPEDPKTLAVSLLDEKQKPSIDGVHPTGQDEVVYEKTFYLVGDQAKVVETALEEVERQTGSSKPGYLLSCALIEFLANRGTREVGDDGRLKYWLNLLEQRYGGKLLWIRDDEVAEQLASMVHKAETAGIADGPSD